MSNIVTIVHLREREFFEAIPCGIERVFQSLLHINWDWDDWVKMDRWMDLCIPSCYKHVIGIRALQRKDGLK